MGVPHLRVARVDYPLQLDHRFVQLRDLLVLRLYSTNTGRNVALNFLAVKKWPTTLHTK
jgi:hypothetical protein